MSAMICLCSFADSFDHVEEVGDITTSSDYSTYLNQVDIACETSCIDPSVDSQLIDGTLVQSPVDSIIPSPIMEDGEAQLNELSEGMRALSGDKMHLNYFTPHFWGYNASVFTPQSIGNGEPYPGYDSLCVDTDPLPNCTSNDFEFIETFPRFG